jgi:tetratricopeptide (TPR) repeat protein
MAKSRKPLFLALGATIAIGAATIPWQMKQWQEVQRLRDETKQNQARLAQIQAGKEAERNLQNQLQQSPQDSASQAQYILLLFQQGRKNEAMPFISKLEEKEANNPDFAAALSDFYNEVGYIDLAIHYAQKAIASNPKSTTDLVRLGFLEIKVGWAKRAEDHIKLANTLSPDAPEPYQALALIAQSHGQYPQGLAHLQKADTLRPKDRHIQIALSQAYKTVNNFAKAVTVLKGVETQLPGDPEVPLLVADTLFIQATKQTSSPAEKTKLLTESEVELQKALKLAPNDLSPYQLLGRIYEERNETDKAIAAWDRLVTSAQGNKRDLFGYARLLLRSPDKDNKAKGKQMIDEYNAFIRQDDKYNQLVLLAGKNPDQPDAHRNLARLCDTLNRVPRGILEWEEVKRLLPNDKEANERLKALRTARGDIQQ